MAQEKQMIPKLMVEAKELKNSIDQVLKRWTEDKQAQGIELSNLC
jgi:hypothetical protein